MTAAGKRVALFALLGLATGALAAAAIMLIDLEGWSLHLVPGLIFGLAFGVVLWARGSLLPLGAAAYALAAALAHGAAMSTAVRLSEPIHNFLGGGDDPAFAACGVVAGAVGGGLLGAVTRSLAPIRRWPALAGAGALLGVLLPVALEYDPIGVFIFYMLWQGGYAATLALVLPRIEKI
jgi:hypothetical protein